MIVTYMIIKVEYFFDVEDPFGYPHHEVEVIGVYDRTASVRDTKTNMTWTVRKNELGLKEKKQAHKYPYHFNYKECKRKWKEKQDKLINTVKSYSDKGTFERGL